jgi:hypothetical protein
MASLKETLRPPVFADEDDNRTARHLNAILLLTAVSLATLTLIRVISDGMRFQLDTTILGSMTVLMVGLLVVLRQRYVRFASYTFLIASWLGMAHLAWTCRRDPRQRLQRLLLTRSGRGLVGGLARRCAFHGAEYWGWLGFCLRRNRRPDSFRY